MELFAASLYKILINYKGKRNFSLEKPGRYYLSQTIKMNIIIYETIQNDVFTDRIE